MTVERTHSTWFHFTKEPKYFAAVDEIREEQVSKAAYVGQRFNGSNKGAQSGSYTTDTQLCEPNPLGKLPGSVWTLDTQACLERIVKGWSPSGICTECGEGRRPVVEKEATGRKAINEGTRGKDPSWSNRYRSDWQEKVRTTITGYTCACPEPTAPTTAPQILISGFDASPLVTTP